MRPIPLAVFLILVTGGFSYAATFECQFAPGQGSGASCAVDTKADLNTASKCLQNYSATLFAQCVGRQTGSGDQLLCFFGNPANPPNLGPHSVVDDQAYAVAIEWASTLGATGVQAMHFAYKDAQQSYSVDCST
jgi:hypothetical protein